MNQDLHFLESPPLIPPPQISAVEFVPDIISLNDEEGEPNTITAFTETGELNFLEAPDQPALRAPPAVSPRQKRRDRILLAKQRADERRKESSQQAAANEPLSTAELFHKYMGTTTRDGEPQKEAEPQLSQSSNEAIPQASQFAMANTPSKGADKIDVPTAESPALLIPAIDVASNAVHENLLSSSAELLNPSQLSLACPQEQAVVQKGVQSAQLDVDSKLHRGHNQSPLLGMQVADQQPRRPKPSSHRAVSIGRRQIQIIQCAFPPDSDSASGGQKDKNPRPQKPTRKACQAAKNAESVPPIQTSRGHEPEIVDAKAHIPRQLALLQMVQKRYPVESKMRVELSQELKHKKHVFQTVKQQRSVALMAETVKTKALISQWRDSRQRRTKCQELRLVLQHLKIELQLAQKAHRAIQDKLAERIIALGKAEVDELWFQQIKHTD